MTKQLELQLDGLDAMRMEMETLAEEFTDWVFQLVDPGGDTPVGTLQIEGYHQEAKKHAGIRLDPARTNDPAYCTEIVDRLRVGLRRSIDELG